MLVTNLVFFRKTPFGPTTLTKVWVWFWVLNSFHHLISLKTCKNIWDVFISHLFKNVFAHVSIYCWERVVEEVKVLVGVHSPKTNNQVLYKATSFETPCICGAVGEERRLLRLHCGAAPGNRRGDRWGGGQGGGWHDLFVLFWFCIWSLTFISMERMHKMVFNAHILLRCGKLWSRVTARRSWRAKRSKPARVGKKTYINVFFLLLDF